MERSPEINVINPIVPLKSYPKHPTTISGKIGKVIRKFVNLSGNPYETPETPEVKLAKEQRLKEMDDYEKKLLDEKKKNLDEHFQKTLVKYRGDEIIGSEVNKLSETMKDEKIDECKRKLGLCKICGEQLDPITFSLNSSLSDDEKRVIIVGNGKTEHGNSIFPKPNKKYPDIEKCVELYGVNRLTKQYGFTPDEIYDAYIDNCRYPENSYSHTIHCNVNCLLKLVGPGGEKTLRKRITKLNDSSDIYCGHKFHKKCILGWIEQQKGVLHQGKVVTEDKKYFRVGKYFIPKEKKHVNCPTCNEPIRQIYYFLPSYCEKIDETGQFIKRNSDGTRSTPAGTTKVIISDNVLKYGGKRKSRHKTARKKRYYKKTRKCK